MWKYVLPLTLFVVPSAQSQTQPDPPAVAQLQKHAMAHQPGLHAAAVAETFVDPRLQLERTMVTNAFVERQVALRRDTEKLLSLAAELKQNVDKTSPSILSLDVIKKAQEIEKLAKSVKDKMKEAY